MGELMDVVTLKKIVATQKRGRPLTVDQAQAVVRMEAGASRDAMLAKARKTAEKYILQGKKLGPAYVEALPVLGDGLPELYEQSKAGKIQAAGAAVLTGAERQRALKERASDIAPLPPVLDPARRRKYREDLLGFGLTYMGRMLAHPPSADLQQIVRLMQEAILAGGKVHTRLPRGKGKSTWAKIATVWALVYGHRRYALVVAATSKAAKRVLKDIRSALTGYGLLGADFPEVCYPLQQLGNAVQRAPYQHIDGELTKISLSSSGMVLPTVAGSKASGSIVETAGITGAFRGAVSEDKRPDLILLDDPQTRKSATSASETATREEIITGEIYGLSGHNTSEAIFMSSTPIRDGDLSCRFADVNAHAEFITETFPLVKKWPKRMDLWEQFMDLFRQDTIARDVTRSLSRGFYETHRAEMDEGAELFDPLDGAPPQELSALHHAMLKRAAMKDAAFMAEYQMEVRPAEALLRITPDKVARQLNGVPEFQVPRQCVEVVGFVDVNATADAALRWSLVAVGPGNVAAVIAYGRYPAKGRLFPLGCTETEEDHCVARGLVAVCSIMATLPITRDGIRRQPYAVAIDGGWKTRAVAAFVSTARYPFKLGWAKGFGWATYRPSSAVGEPGNHCHLSQSKNGTFLAVCADYWREFGQRALMAPPLQRGSLSLFGDDPLTHAQYADELCAEHLTDKGISDRGTAFWTWSKTGPNHYADTVTGCLALAAWHRLLSAPEDISMAAVTAAASAAGAPLALMLPRHRRRIITLKK